MIKIALDSNRHSESQLHLLILVEYLIQPLVLFQNSVAKQLLIGSACKNLESSFSSVLHFGVKVSFANYRLKGVKYSILSRGKVLHAPFLANCAQSFGKDGTTALFSNSDRA